MASPTMCRSQWEVRFTLKSPVGPSDLLFQMPGTEALWQEQFTVWAGKQSISAAPAVVADTLSQMLGAGVVLLSRGPVFQTHGAGADSLKLQDNQIRAFTLLDFGHRVRLPPRRFRDSTKTRLQVDRPCQLVASPTDFQL